MTLSNLIRRIRLAIGRVHVPHCEDCKFYRPENTCARYWGGLYADNCRKDEDICGKHARHFEPKDKA